MSEKQSSLIHLTIGLLLLWSFITVAVFAVLDTADSVLLALALVAAIGAMALVRPFPRAGLLAAALAVVYFLVVQGYRVVAAESVLTQTAPTLALLATSPLLLKYLVVTILGVVCFAAVGLSGDSAAGRLGRLHGQIAQHTTTIEELTLRDGVTGAVKTQYADRLLTQEIERSRRYNRPLSLLLLGADDWAKTLRERGQSGAQEALKIAGELLNGGVRPVDTVAKRDDSQFLVILPETPLVGAQIVAERQCRGLAAQAKLQYRAGVVEFPTDAVTKEDILAEVEAALQFAQMAGVGVVSRNLLQ